MEFINKVKKRTKNTATVPLKQLSWSLEMSERLSPGPNCVVLADVE